MSRRWKIFYSDGSTFSNKEGKPSDAPKRGVQVVHVEDGRCGRRVLRLADYYVWSPTLDRWLDCLDAASVLIRAQTEPFIVVLFGEYLVEADYEKILIQSHEDQEVPAVAPDEPPHPAWR